MESHLSLENFRSTFPSLREFENLHKIRWYHLCGENSHSILLMTDDGHLYGLGENGTGVLGLGHTNPVLEPTEIVSMRDVKIDTISSGLFHVMAKTTGGLLYRWGGTQYGQCAKQKGIVSPCLLLDGKSFRSVRCGTSFNMALSEDGMVYSWGSNCYGQLGGGAASSRFRPMPIQELRNKEIVSIECGGWHSLALTKSGQVYAWGLNDSGQLFRPVLQKNQVKPHCVELPTLVDSLNRSSVKICAIAAGLGHSLVLTDKGHIMACGHNQWGQLGQPTENESIDNPIVLWIPLEQNDPFVWIYANRNFSLAATRSGRYFGWGQFNNCVNYCTPKRFFLECKQIKPEEEEKEDKHLF